MGSSGIDVCALVMSRPRGSLAACKRSKLAACCSALILGSSHAPGYPAQSMSWAVFGAWRCFSGVLWRAASGAGALAYLDIC